MGEELPQEPQQPIEAQEAAIEQVSQDASHATEPVADSSHVEVVYPDDASEDVAEAASESAEDSRWDKDKAETMAHVLKDKGEVDRFASVSADRRSFVDSGKFAEIHTIKEKGSLSDSEDFVNQQESEIEDAKRRGLDLGGAPYHLERLKDQKERAQQQYDEALESAEQKGSEWLKEDRSERESSMLDTLTPFEELYDLNPDHFANMPTHEFMVEAKHLARLKLEYSEARNGAIDLSRRKQRLQDLIEVKQLYPFDRKQVIVNEITYAQNIDFGEEYNEVIKQVEDAFEGGEEGGSFDRAPRQIMESLVNLVDDYLQKVQERQTAAEQKKAEFLEQYKPSA